MPEFNMDLSGLGHGESTRNVLLIDCLMREITVDEISRNGGAIYNRDVAALPLPRIALAQDRKATLRSEAATRLVEWIIEDVLDQDGGLDASEWTDMLADLIAAP